MEYLIFDEDEELVDVLFLNPLQVKQYKQENPTHILREADSTINESTQILKEDSLDSGILIDDEDDDLW